MRRWHFVILILLLLVNAGRAAAGDDCRLPIDPFGEVDVVVVARQMTSPIPGVLVLSVERYHKGDGARILIADMPGLWGIERWQAKISNLLALNQEGMNHRIFGFRHGPGLQLKNLPCDPDYPVDPTHYLTQALPSLGGGQAPAAGISMRSNGAIVQPLLLLSAGIILWIRSRRRHN